MSNTISLEFISCEENNPDKSGRYVVIKIPKEIGEANWDSRVNAWFDENRNRRTDITHWAERPKEWPDLKPYTPKWLWEKMRECYDMQDKEYGHIAADDLLCETLKANGYGDAINLFNNLPKWYS